MPLLHSLFFISSFPHLIILFFYFPARERSFGSLPSYLVNYKILFSLRFRYFFILNYSDWLLHFGWFPKLRTWFSSSIFLYGTGLAVSIDIILLLENYPYFFHSLFDYLDQPLLDLLFHLPRSFLSNWTLLPPQRRGNQLLLYIPFLPFRTPTSIFA